MIFGLFSLYDVFLSIGIVVSLFLADRMGIMRGFSITLQKLLIIDGVLAILFGLLGAVLFQAVYNGLKTGVFEINESTGMTFYGGLIFGVVGFLQIWFIIGKRKCKDGEQIKQFGSLADIAACIIPMAHGFGRLGCFTAGCCHGKETDAWFGVKMLTETGWKRVVPLQLFEAVFLFVLAGVLFWLFFGKFGKENKGRFPLMPIYAVGYGVWRFFIEYARADDRGATVVAFLTPSQLIAVLMIIAGIVYFGVWFYKKKKIDRETGDKKE